MGEPVNHRVVFEDGDLLRASQRRRVLQRCWLNLQPSIAPIADLSAHLHATYGLQSSCSNGLIISMDGFVLPSFESTCILKDEDIIMSESSGNDGGHVSKNAVNGDAGKVPSRSSRRKKAKRLQYRTLKKEKQVKQETTLKQLCKTMDLRATPMPSFYQEGPTPDTELKKVPSRSSRRKKAKRLQYSTLKKEKQVKQETTLKQLSKTMDLRATPMPSFYQEGPLPDTELKKVPSRSSRRKKAKRLQYRTLKKEKQGPLRWNGTTSKKKGKKRGRENTFNKWDDDTSNWLSNGESSNAKEAELVEVSNEKSAVEEVEAYKESIVNKVEPVKECNGNFVAEQFEAVKQLIEFESFLPLIRLPEEDDVLVYSVVELSSSRCPELSPLRVGRVSSYDCSSSKVVLLPLPEYPLLLEEMSEDGQESRSLYKEDGTLEVDFASLVNVRLFKARESKEITPNTTPIEEMQNAAPENSEEMRHAAPVNNQKSASCSSNMVEIRSNHTVNDQLSEGWDAINQALNEKKSQLRKQNDLDKRNSSLGTTTTGPWSYRAQRRNALGPTLAMLRSSNGDTDK